MGHGVESVLRGCSPLAQNVLDGTADGVFEGAQRCARIIREVQQQASASALRALKDAVCGAIEDILRERAASSQD